MSKYESCRNSADIKLMKSFLGVPDYFRQVIITENQIDIIRMIESEQEFTGYMTALEFSETKEITVQNASAQLAKLWRKGYLKRREVVAKTGGIEYRYISAINA